jgi:hypothetical protein
MSGASVYSEIHEGVWESAVRKGIKVLSVYGKSATI